MFLHFIKHQIFYAIFLISRFLSFFNGRDFKLLTKVHFLFFLKVHFLFFLSTHVDYISQYPLHVATWLSLANERWAEKMCHFQTWPVKKVSCMVLNALFLIQLMIGWQHGAATPTHQNFFWLLCKQEINFYFVEPLHVWIYVLPWYGLP